MGIVKGNQYSAALSESESLRFESPPTGRTAFSWWPMIVLLSKFAVAERAPVDRFSHTFSE